MVTIFRNADKNKTLNNCNYIQLNLWNEYNIPLNETINQVN